MRVVDAKVERFSGSLPGVVGNATATWRERSGLLLTLVDEKGHTAQGEATPLPGYSPDDVDACHAALLALDWDELVGPGDGALPGWLGDASRHVAEGLPAARFAVETALLDLRAQQSGQPAWSLLRSSVRRLDTRPLSIPLSGLLATPHTGTSDLLAAAGALIDRGLGTLKLKLGSDGDLAHARALRDHFGDRVLLRFDVNRAWPAAEAAVWLEELASVVPELVEEPTASLDALGRSPVPLALDESLQTPGALERPRASLAALRVDAVVLKPAVLGGIGRSVELARQAQNLGLGVIVSHLFDGPVALAAAAALALAVASPERASGLDRHAGLGAWPDVSIPVVGRTHVIPVDRPGLCIEPVPGPRS